jgi:hypothetical protein
MSTGYVFTRTDGAHTIPQAHDSYVNVHANRKSELLVEARHEVASAMGPLARVFTCWRGPGPPRPKAQAEAKPGQTEPGRRIWLAGEAFEDTASYVFLRVGEARAQSQAQDQAKRKPSQSVSPTQTIATCFHMPGGPQEPPGHLHIRVFTCRRRPSPSPHPSPSPAQAKPDHARPGSNLV